MSVWGRWKATVDGWALHHKELPRPWRLYRLSFREYRQNWKLLIVLLSIIEIPVAILSSTVVQPGTDTSSAAYVAFAEVIMNVALIYTVVRIINGKTVSVREAYYLGSAMIVRMLLLSLIFVLMMIPLFLGGLILGAGLLAPGSALAPGERMLVLLLAIAVAIPSVVLLVRSAWATFVVFETQQGPWQAVKTVRKHTRGKVVVLLGRLLALVALLALTLLIPAAILGILSASTHAAIFGIILQYLLTTIILPISGFYLYRLYRGVMA